LNNKLKKKIYLILWVITGILFGFLIGNLIELGWLYLAWGTNLPLWIYVVTILLGTIFGFWAGPKAWQKIYIEGARGKKYIIKP